MKKVKMILNWCIPLVLIAIALMTPTVTQAVGYGTVWVWPEDLIPISPNRDYVQTPNAVSNGEFYVFFKLPKGSSILGVTYYHYGYASSTGQEALTEVYLYQQKKLPGEFGSGFGYGVSGDMTSAIIPVDVTLLPTKPFKIRPEYRYFIYVHCMTESSYFMGAKISYMTP